MAVDGKGNLIVGTEPGGLVLRVSPAGEGFVLYQMPKKEVTAVAVAPDGAIYAAAVGTRQPTRRPQCRRGSAFPRLRRWRRRWPAVRRSCGSLLHRLPRRCRRAWRAAAKSTASIPMARRGACGDIPQDVVYAIAFDAAGRALLGAGNKGNIYRIESPTVYTSLLALPATQVTAFQAGRDGRLYAATGNAGKVYEIGPGLEHEGAIESDVFDSGLYSLWGRLSFEANLNGGQVGDGDAQRQPGPAAEELERVGGGTGRRARAARVTSPAARFVQWKATLTAGGIRRNSIRWMWPTCRRIWSRASTRSKSRRRTTGSRLLPRR